MGRKIREMAEKRSHLCMSMEILSSMIQHSRNKKHSAEMEEALLKETIKATQQVRSSLHAYLDVRNSIRVTYQ